MPLCRTPQRHQGFTLIEVMIVVLIVGITVSFAVLSVRGTDYQDLLQEEASRLRVLLQLASEEAIMQNSELAVSLNPTSYTFLLLNEEDEIWEPVSGDDMFRTRDMPEGLELELRSVEELGTLKTDSRKKLVPHVFLLSSGEITPFELTFSSPESEVYYIVTGTPDGQLELHASDEPREP